MEMTAVSLFILVVLVPADSVWCPPSFATYRNNCYWVSPKLTIGNWVDAGVYCFVMGGDLVDILSADEDKFIRNTLANIIDREGCKGTECDFWTAANDVQTEGTFRWLKNAVSFKNWHSSQPDNAGSGQNCVAISQKYGYLWIDEDCSIMKRFICKR